MKNKYFFLIIITALSFRVSAQGEQSYSEGFAFTFAFGSIHGQNGWQALDNDGNEIGGYTISEDEIAEFDQPPFLKVSQDTNFSDSDNRDYLCMSPSLISSPFNLNIGNASVSFRIDPDMNDQTSGANYEVQIKSNQDITAAVIFGNDGSIRVADMIEGVFTYVLTDATWTAGEWKQLNIYINMEQKSLRYNIMGEDIYEGNLLDGNSLEQFVILNDNKSGSVAYFDSLFVFGSSEILGADENVMSKVQIYPNPANQMISISGIENINEKNITLTTIEGKTVTSISRNNGSDKINVDISGLASGVYIIDIPFSNGSLKKRIIKQ